MAILQPVKTCGQAGFFFHIILVARDRGGARSTRAPKIPGIPSLYRYRHGPHFSLCQSQNDRF
jgi:hypothetical protein